MNKKQVRQQRLEEHYEKCAALAKRLGAIEPSGKRISNALLKLERQANNAATAQCSGEAYGGEPFRDENQWEQFKAVIEDAVHGALGVRSIPGFFINGDPRGYALKIDNKNTEGKKLIEDLRMHKDWGGYGILSPEITAD